MRTTTRLLVTGGAGFIGSAFIRTLLRKGDFIGSIINLDKLTYAADLSYLKGFENHPRYQFIQGDILHQSLVETLLLEKEIDAIVHFAAETHVDRSIGSASPFVQTNILGTLSLLEAVRRFPHVHFHHVSTDEVYGSLGESGRFYEHSPYRPNSPYAASKAGSDHLVRSFAQTYGLSTTLSHCGNNYGPCQHPEKFIPLMIKNCLKKEPLPVYGKGANVREWLYVEDHVEAIWRIVQFGKKGEVYNIGGEDEKSNLELLYLLIDLMKEELPRDYESLIQFVQDRPGHDFRYALDTTKIRKELGWAPKVSLKEGLRKTVRWYTQRLASILKV